jgi:prenyl protein peptidase
VFQLAYTTLFGAHCAFLYLRTQSLWPTVTAHMWCNVMGVPQLADETKRFADRKICEFISALCEAGTLTTVSAIYVAYVLGVATYVYGMRNWTLAEGTRW